MEFLKKLWNRALIKLNIRKKVEEIKTEVSEEVKHFVAEVETVSEEVAEKIETIETKIEDKEAEVAAFFYHLETPKSEVEDKFNMLKHYVFYLKDKAHKLGNKDILSKIEDLEPRLTIDNYENIEEESKKLAMEMNQKIELISDGNKPKDESVELIKDTPTQPLEVETVKDIKSKSRKKPNQKFDDKKEVNPKKQEPKKKEGIDKGKPKRKPKPKSE